MVNAHRAKGICGAVLIGVASTNCSTPTPEPLGFHPRLARALQHYAPGLAPGKSVKETTPGAHQLVSGPLDSSSLGYSGRLARPVDGYVFLHVDVSGAAQYGAPQASQVVNRIVLRSPDSSVFDNTKARLQAYLGEPTGWLCVTADDGTWQNETMYWQFDNLGGAALSRPHRRRGTSRRSIRSVLLSFWAGLVDISSIEIEDARSGRCPSVALFADTSEA
jgi:hypothetical protein